MNKILAKQVEGGVDINSDQIIEGTKTFSAPIICDKNESSHHMVNVNGFIYWVNNPDKLDENGNFRLGVVNSQLSIQHYSDKNWITDSK